MNLRATAGDTSPWRRDLSSWLAGLAFVASLISAAPLAGQSASPDPGMSVARPLIAESMQDCVNSAPQLQASACNSVVSSQLTTADCSDSGTYFEVFHFFGISGQTVTIDMASTAFDTGLALRRFRNEFVAVNDDVGSCGAGQVGAGCNSRIEFTLDSTETWHVIAYSAKSSQLGGYTLTLQCSSTPPAPPDPPVAAATDFESFTPGTPAESISVPGMRFSAGDAVTAAIQDASDYPGLGRSGRVLVWKQNATIPGLRLDGGRSGGLRVDFSARISRISFDLWIKGRNRDGQCVVDRLDFAVDNRGSPALGGSYAFFPPRPCPVGYFYPFHVEFDQEESLGFTFFEIALAYDVSPEALAQDEFVIDNYTAFGESACTTPGRLEITSHPSGAPISVPAGTSITLSWNPSQNLFLGKGCYAVVASRSSSFQSPIYLECDTATSATIPIPDSATDYSLYVGVGVYQYCAPNVGGISTREFAVTAKSQARAPVLPPSGPPPRRSLRFRP